MQGIVALGLFFIVAPLALLIVGYVVLDAITKRESQMSKEMRAAREDGKRRGLWQQIDRCL